MKMSGERKRVTYRAGRLCRERQRAMVVVAVAWVALSWGGGVGEAAPDNVYLTYHWHLHQPIYWPEKHPTLNRYQFAKDSIDLKLSNTGNFYPGSSYKHPRNNLVSGDGGEYDSVFDKADRVIAYQNGGRDSIATLSGHANAGASVSYSGALQENIWSLGAAGAYGYRSGWNAGYADARAWHTSGGYPKADMLGMTYHHAFSPLLPRSVLRKEIRIFKEIWYKSWNGASDKSDHSRGFWPVECAFSEAMIPVLVEEGYEWTIVANSHLARTCPNYMDVATRGTSGWNIDPPNRADQLGPVVPAGQWYSGTRDARGGTFPVPYAYQAHRVKYVDPETGAESLMTAVPMCDYLSYENGYGQMGTGVIDAEIEPFAGDASHPCLVLMAHDGDNAWGGGSSYYMESVPNLMNGAAGRGYHPTTIQQFLAEHPAPTGDLVHIEDGAWVNAANDWGHPQFINWLWPPARDPSDAGYDYNDPRTWFDIEHGFAEDWRNWAVIVAAANYCETAEQIAAANGRDVADWRIQEPVQRNGTDNGANNAEQAWHYMLGALDSGFMYYGNSLDDEVKQSLACNRATGHAEAAIADNGASAADTTPPTVFKPQRYPWNPGGMGWGPTTGYRPIGFDGAAPHDSDFHIWTLAFDVSGMGEVTAHVRRDNDGVNPLSSNQNELYAGGGEVGAWSDFPMTRRDIAPDEGDNGTTLDFFILPNHIASHYWAKITGYKSCLVDYYVTAVDARGNTFRSDIQHVYIGDGGRSGSSVTFSEDPRDCAPLGVAYHAAGGPLAGAGAVTMRLSFDGGGSWTNHAMQANGTDEWVSTNTVPDNAPSATVTFQDGDGSVVDDNGGGGWTTTIRDCDAPTGPAAVTFEPAAPSNCTPVTIVYHPNDGPLRYASQVYIHIGRDGWQDVVTPDPAMTPGASNTWRYVYAPPPGTEAIDCCFNDGATWDNNHDANWWVSVTGCPDAPIVLVPGSPAVTADPAEQNSPADAFDFDLSGNYLRTRAQAGFGGFGHLFVNYDATNLYVGAMGCDLAGDNNGMVLFLGLNTLPYDVGNLWSLAGLPNGLDNLHNVLFDAPMDVALVLGDEWGDGTYTNFDLGNGYDFGQGVYALTTNTGSFTPLPGARLSQYDGSGTNATGEADYDGDRLMNRWEAAIPWRSLGATGVTDLVDFRVCGVIASDGVSGNDRYLSGNYLGEAASGTTNATGNYGFGIVVLTPAVVGLPDSDFDGDGLPDAWEFRHASGLGQLTATGDWDGDGARDIDEYRAGTDPVDPTSVFAITGVSRLASGQVVVRWRGVAGRQYGIYAASNMPPVFKLLRGDIAGIGGMNVHTDEVPYRAGERFYRVGTNQPEP